MILFPPFKVWCHYPQYNTDEETDWKAKLLAQKSHQLLSGRLVVFNQIFEFPNILLSTGEAVCKVWFKDHCRSSSFQRVHEDMCLLFFWIFVCGQIAFLLFQPKSNVLSEWMQKQSECIKTSYLLISQILRKNVNIKQSHSCYFLILQSHFSYKCSIYINMQWVYYSFKMNHYTLKKFSHIILLNMVLLPKLQNWPTFDTIFIKNSSWLSGKLILNYIKKSKGLRIAKTILKKNKVGGLTSPNFKTCYKVT